MTDVIYEVVQHDGGWAYCSNGVYSETFSTHDEALAAARRVAAEHQIGGRTREISYQDADGKWHREVAQGDDRPEAEVKDDGD
ncbi:MAG: DUF2188 domain-containing protein [Rhizobiaceae bacterium]|nr:DUF2188 domain-containing protein [Rhizobiaceae bacterium]MCV0406085.1 DUF2188 domain-containing protein [Rhizobiaceae bacterium]